MTADFKTLYQKLCSNYGVEKQPAILEAITPDGHLDLSNQFLHPPTCAVLGKIFEISKQITKVSLENCLLEEESLKLLLLGLTINFSVIFLNLKGNAIQGPSALRIAELLRTNATIRSLSLEWNSLGLCVSSFSKICEALVYNKSLSKLDFRNNQLNYEAAKAISELISKTSSLSTLDIRFNNFGDEGGKTILQGVRFSRNLTCLLINGNNVSDHIMDDIARQLSNNVRMSAARDEYVVQSDMLKQRLKLQEQQASLHIEKLEKSLTSVNQSMSSVIRDSRAKIEMLEDELASKSEQLQVLNLKYEALSKSMGDRNKLNETIKKENKALEEEIRNGRESRNQLLREIDEMRDAQVKWESSKEEIFALKDQLIALEATFKATKTEAEEELETEKGKHKDALRKQEKSFSLQNAKLRKEIDEKEGELKKSKKLWETSREELETEIRTLKTSISADREEHQADISSLRHQLKNENRNEMRILENELKEIVRSREEVEVKLRVQISTCASMSSANARLESQVHTMSTEIASLQTEVDGKEVSIRAAEQGIRNEMKKQLQEFQDLKEEKAKLEIDLANEKRKKENIVSDFESSLSQKEEEIKRLRNTIVEREKEVIRIKEDETRRAGMLQSAFLQYLRPSGDQIHA